MSEELRKQSLRVRAERMLRAPGEPVDLADWAQRAAEVLAIAAHVVEHECGPYDPANVAHQARVLLREWEVLDAE